MSKKILVYDEVYRMLEEAKGQRLEDGWKRGASLEQIASEAIIFWCSQGDNEKFRDVNDIDLILREGGKPVKKALEEFK